LSLATINYKKLPEIIRREKVNTSYDKIEIRVCFIYPKILQNTIKCQVT
jgi:hypothetical protein